MFNIDNELFRFEIMYSLSKKYIYLVSSFSFIIEKVSRKLFQEVGRSDTAVCDEREPRFWPYQHALGGFYPTYPTYPLLVGFLSQAPSNHASYEMSRHDTPAARRPPSESAADF